MISHTKKILFKDLLEGTKQKTTEGTAKNIIRGLFLFLEAKKTRKCSFRGVFNSTLRFPLAKLELLGCFGAFQDEMKFHKSNNKMRNSVLTPTTNHQDNGIH